MADDPRASEGVDPVLEALWTRVVSAWDDEKTHAALVEYGVQTTQLPEVASRYRALTADPEKGAAARKKLEAVSVAATQLLLSTRTPRRERIPLPITLTAFAICAVLLAWLAYAWLR